MLQMWSRSGKVNACASQVVGLCEWSSSVFDHVFLWFSSLLPLLADAFTGSVRISTSDESLKT